MHVGIIMDGNGRWATRQGLSRMAGHKKGALAAEEIIRSCLNLGVDTLTLYAFSTENWQRERSEVISLMTLFETYITRHIQDFVSNNIKITFLGNKEKLSQKLVKIISDATQRTCHNKKFCLNVAINYGGRDEILRAVRRIATKVESGSLKSQDISEETISQMLDTSLQSDPDLIIRTAGEQRLSNFLSWQSAYSEFYFSKVEWPEFNGIEFLKALESYKSRVRSFGAVAGE